MEGGPGQRQRDTSVAAGLRLRISSLNFHNSVGSVLFPPVRPLKPRGEPPTRWVESWQGQDTEAGGHGQPAEERTSWRRRSWLYP